MALPSVTELDVVDKGGASKSPSDCPAELSWLCVPGWSSEAGCISSSAGISGMSSASGTVSSSGAFAGSSRLCSVSPVSAWARVSLGTFALEPTAEVPA